MHVMEMYSVLPFAADKNGNVVEANFPIREMLQKSDDEARNGKLWYFDDTISGYEKLLK